MYANLALPNALVVIAVAIRYTAYEETSQVAVHFHVTVWRTLFSVPAVKHRG